MRNGWAPPMTPSTSTEVMVSPTLRRRSMVRSRITRAAQSSLRRRSELFGRPRRFMTVIMRNICLNVCARVSLPMYNHAAGPGPTQASFSFDEPKCINAASASARPSETISSDACRWPLPHVGTPQLASESRGGSDPACNGDGV